MERISIKRLIIYLCGMVSVSLGIVLCAQCGLGISPISSVPFVLKEILPLTFGQLTMLFHFVNILLQMLLLKKLADIKLLLQIPVAFAFGWMIDFIKAMITINQGNILVQLLALVLSIFFTALGMVMMVQMNLVQNPPDGFVKCAADASGKEFGNVKITYDILCVVIAIGIGMLFLHRPYGMGIATLASALFVGKTVTLIRKMTGIEKKDKI
jgi:uncharacterized membrane protein YczE